MTPSRNRDDPRVAPERVVSRCPACGRRVLGACPVHGAEARSTTDDDAPSAVIDLPRIPGYRVRRLVARGGFGAVYEAEPFAGGAAVAVKIPRADRPDASARLDHEIGVLLAVGPPHVPALHTRGRLADGAPYVVMEYLDSPTLADRLSAAEPGAGSVAFACSIGAAILAALGIVHDRGYVHRDLKPENLVVHDRTRITLVDFGLAWALDPALRAPEDTAEGAAVGTAEYMSPEQCEGRDDVDARADLYSFGVILFEIVAGRPPFWGPRAQVQESHLSRRPPRLATICEGRAVPAALDELVARCLAKDRRERFASAGELRAALAAVRAEDSPPSRRASSPSIPSEIHGERLTLGLLFFEATEPVTAVEARVLSTGGQLAYASGRRYVAAFGHDPDHNPALRALRAAEELLGGGIAARVRLDLARVTVQLRRGGALRFVSPLFAREDRYPATDGPPGLDVLPAATAVLPEAARAPEEITLVGREGVLSTLVEGARRAMGLARPAITAVVAAGGLGKSRLARALADRLAQRAFAERDAEVILLRAREPLPGDVDHTLGELLRRALDLPAGPPPEGALESLAQGLGGASDLVPPVALALGWLSPGDPGEALGPALRRLGAAPGALRAALTVAVGEALRRRAAARPIFLVLDDAHFAGEAVLSALGYAALAEAAVPLWIGAFGRPASEDHRSAWSELAARDDTIHLGPLDARSAAALCRQLLLPVEDVPESAVELLVARTQAIPLLLVELLRGLRRGGIVRRSPRGAWYLATDELDHLPDLPLIEWLARSELDALAPALRSHARLLALLGEQVSLAEIAGVLARLDPEEAEPELPLDAGVAARRLVAAGIAAAGAEGRLGLRHALVREAIARSSPESLRDRVHLAAAAYHREAKGPEGSEERRLSQLAHHAAAAGLGEEAERLYLGLAARARARHAYTEAERLYSHALAQPREGGEEGRAGAYRGRGMMRYRTGRHHDAVADFRRAFALARDAGDTEAAAEILLEEATALDWMADFKTSATRVEEAWALGPEPRSPGFEARLLLGLGRSALRGSRNEEAAALLERAVAAAEPLGDEGYELLVIALPILGFILPGLGRTGDARVPLDRAIGLAELHGDRLHLGSALSVRALFWANQGDKARMVADMDRSLSLARELGQGALELIGEYNLGEYLLLMDDAAAAESHVLRAAALDRRISGDPGRAVVTLLKARLDLHRGDAASASALVAEIRARQAASAEEPESALAPSEDVLCALVELGCRGASEAAWEELELLSERFSVGQERIEVIEARAVAAFGRGDRESARCHLDRALELAARIPNAMGARLARLGAALGL